VCGKVTAFRNAPLLFDAPLRDERVRTVMIDKVEVEEQVCDKEKVHHPEGE
jgi:hypothetical protein